MTSVGRAPRVAEARAALAFFWALVHVYGIDFFSAAVFARFSLRCVGSQAVFSEFVLGYYERKLRAETILALILR
jgi:hypothetical protein